jgi:hypothetical protein
LKYVQIHVIHTFYLFCDWNSAKNHSKYLIVIIGHVFFYGKLWKLSIWFESLLKNGAFIRCLFRIKLEIILDYTKLLSSLLYVALNLEPVDIFGWRIHVGHENSYQMAIKSLFCPKCRIAIITLKKRVGCSDFLHDLFWISLPNFLLDSKVQNFNFFSKII